MGKNLSLLLTHEIDNYGPGSGHSQGQRPIDIQDTISPWGCSVEIMELEGYIARKKCYIISGLLRKY